MINNNVFLMINELVSRAAGIDDAGIVDESSLIDYGRKLADMDSEDFKNAFAKEIANKVRLSIDVVRKYKGKLESFTKGNMPAGGVLEIIQHMFMETRAADFTQLIDGTSPDQYIIKNAAQTADYFIMESAFSLFVTISDTELEGAFTSVSAMQNFLNAKITYLLNSYELAREQGRRSLLNTLIADLDDATAATGNEDSAQKYELVTLYNTTYGLEGEDALTADNALYSSEFIKFAVMMINKVYRKISNPSVRFNDGSIKTFTPDGLKKLVTIDALDSSIVGFKTSFQSEATVLPTHESVEFWQSEAHPLTVTLGDVTIIPTAADLSTATADWVQVAADGKYYQKVAGEYVEKTGAEAAATQSETSATIAVLFDDMRIGEYKALEKTIATPVNARSLYYNVWLHYQGRLVSIKSANAVVFTLD